MQSSIGEQFTDLFKKYMPDSFVFALILTLIISLVAVLWLDTSIIKVIESWYDGFWLLLEFGMQMTLLIITVKKISLALFKFSLRYFTYDVEMPKSDSWTAIVNIAINNERRETPIAAKYHN